MAAKAPAVTLAMPVLYSGAKVLDNKITAMHAAGQSLQTEMHTLALSVLAHLGKHHDVRMVLKFINAMPEIARSNALCAWFERFGPIKFSVIGKDITAVSFKDNKVKLADANAKPFWKFNAKEGTPYEPLDIDKTLERVIKQFQLDAKNTGRDHTDIINKLIAGKMITKAVESSQAKSEGFSKSLQ